MISCEDSQWTEIHNDNAEKGMSKYPGWRRELPDGARQCRQILKVLPEQPDQGRKACVSPDGLSPLSR